MEYNKNDFQKMNDKKVLHKVRKHWVVVSLAMLMALGGTAAATHVSANADATTSNSNAQSNTQTPKENQGQSLVKSANNTASAQNNNQAQANNRTASANTITNAASQLHQRILGNMMNQKPAANNQLGAQQNVQANGQNNAEQQSTAAPKVSNHVNVPKMGLGQSANGRGVLGARLDASVNGTANKVDVNANQNSRKAALTNSRVAKMLGESSANSNNSDSSQFYIHYLDKTQNNKEINEKYTGYSTNPNNSFSMKPYLSVLSKGYQLADGNTYDYNGHTYNVDTDPTISETAGNHDIDVIVTPKKAPGRSYVRINYLNASDSNATVNAIVAANSDTATFSGTDLQGYLKTPPDGYLVDDYGKTNAGDVTVDGLNNGQALPDSSNFTVKYGNGQPDNITNVNIEVRPISNPNQNYAQGNILYENAADNDSFVTSEPFKQTLKGQTDLSHYTSYVPNGYKYDSNISPIADSTWENGDNDVIFVTPDGTNRNIPSTKAGYSFVTVNYVDSKTGKLINQSNAVGKTNASFDYNDYVNNYVPTNYKEVSADPEVNNFPAHDGQTSNVTVKVSLDPTVDPNSGSYNPTKAQSSNNKYASTKIQYVDVSDGQPVDQEVSLDSEPIGSVINYSPYISNLPSGWKYAGMGSHETNVVGGAVVNGFNYGVIDPNAANGVDKYANVIYVSKMNTDAQPITVEYFNQYDKQVGTDTIDKNTDSNYDNQLDQNIDVTNPTGQKSTVPTGYVVDSGENTTYQITNNPQTAKILVTGQPVKQSATVKTPKANPDGSSTNSSSSINAVLQKMSRNISDASGNNQQPYSDYMDYLQDPVFGQQFTIDPNKIAPLGYKADDNQKSVTYEIDDNNGTAVATPIALNGQAIGNQTVPTAYNYRQIPATQQNKQLPATTGTGNNQKPNPSYPFDALVKPITVQFINQKGNIVPDKDGQKSYQINGRYNQKVDVVTANGTNEMPTGYTLNPQNGNVFYTFTDDPQTANVLVTGDAINDNPGNPGATPTNNQIPSNAHDGNGNQLPNAGKALKNNQILLHRVMNSQAGVSSDYTVISKDGNVGDTSTIDPTASEPSDYDIAAGDQDYSTIINKDGSLTVKDSKGQPVNNQEITYDYNKQTDTVHVVYVNQNGGAVVKTIDATGEDGAPFDNDVYNKDLMPAGYTKNMDYYNNQAAHELPTFRRNTDGSPVTYEILVNQADKMSVNYYDVTGGKYQELLGDSKYETGEDDTNYSVPSDDTKFVPAGYTFASDYSGNGMTKGVSAPSAWTSNGVVNIAVTKDPNTPINTDLGSVTVHYIKTDNQNDTSSNDEVDAVTVSGDVGSHFNMTKYDNMSPAGYQVNGKTNGDVSRFEKGNQDVYVDVDRLTKNTPGAQIPLYSTINVEYDDVKGNKIETLNNISTQKTGSKVDYSQFKNVLPQGYVFVAMGNTTAKYEPGATEHLIVAKPAPAYGTVTINYLDDSNNGAPMSSDTIVANGKNGSSFDMSNYEDSTPQGYSFKSATANGNQNGFIDYFTGTNQTLDIHVAPTPVPHNYSSIKVIYKDAAGHIGSIPEKETGYIGDVFDLTNFEHNCPEGGHYAGISGKVPSVFPSYSNSASQTSDKAGINTVTLLVKY